MIQIASPQIGKEEREAVDRVLRSGIIAQGPEVAEFEKEFANLSVYLRNVRFSQYTYRTEKTYLSYSHNGLDLIPFDLTCLQVLNK